MMIVYSGTTSTEISSEVGGTATVGPAPPPSLMPVPPHTMGVEGETVVPTVLPMPFLGTPPARPSLMFYRAPGTVSIDPDHCSVNLNFFVLNIINFRKKTKKTSEMLYCMFISLNQAVYVFLIFFNVWFKNVKTEI